MSRQTRLVEVRQQVLKQNDVVARALRDRFHGAGVFVVSLVSSPGSGKTAFLEKTLTMLRREFRVAALVGDLATDNDARRLARSEVPVKQITTGTLCHLEAEMVRTALEGWNDNDSISCSSKTSAIWSVPRRSTSAKACGSCSFGHRRGRQAVEISDDFQHRRRGSDHQDRPCRRGGVQSRRGPSVHSVGASWHGDHRSLSKSGRGMDEFLKFLISRRLDPRPGLESRRATVSEAARSRGCTSAAYVR